MKKLLLSMAFVATTGFVAFATYAGTAATDLNAQTGTTATGSVGTDQAAATDLTVQTDAAVAATVPDATVPDATAVDPAMPAPRPILRDGFASADLTAITLDVVIGAKAYDANDAWIGEVSELIIDSDSKMTDVVVDVGGFLGMGEKPVALQVADLDILRASAGGEVRVYISMMKDQLEALPTYAR